MKTSLFKPLYFLKWRPIFDDFYSTECKTQKLFKGLVVDFRPKGMPGRMYDIRSEIILFSNNANNFFFVIKRSPGTHGLVKNPLPVCNEDQQVII